MRRNYIQQLVLFFACLIISVSCNREENACRLKEIEHLISENPQMALDSLKYGILRPLLVMPLIIIICYAWLMLKIKLEQKWLHLIFFSQ